MSRRTPRSRSQTRAPQGSLPAGTLPACGSRLWWGPAVASGLFLTWIFWWPLWLGGGLIGGDLYPYYFPQKVFYGESLHQGFIPLWNPYVGFGYPVLGESQTGALYPPHLLLYSWLSPNTAYHVNQLLHFVVAFVATWGLARRLGLTNLGSCLAATAFVYGWFPARICLEWAIVGGAWFALILWSATVFLQDRSRRALLCVSLFLGLSLLAGHYNLAFITLLSLIGLAFLVPAKQVAPPAVNESSREQPPPVNSSRRWKRLRDLAIRHPLLPLGVAVCCGFLIAAPQLIPSWELKAVSQRQGDHPEFSATYGHLPPAAISQLWMPWAWSAGEESTDRYLEQTQFLRVPTATNSVEAQLYVGIVVLLLAALGVLLPPLRRRLPLVRSWGWVGLVLVSLIFASGWPTYWFSDLPGLGYFRGPGRYSMVAAWSLALLAGGGLDALFRYWGEVRHGPAADRLKSARGYPGWLAFVVILSVTVADLWAASRKYDFGVAPFIGRQVYYATMIDHPPVDVLHESPLRAYFAERPRARLYAPGQNAPSLFGVSCLPVYLGLGPSIYEIEALRVDFTTLDPEQIRESRRRLKEFGVTHLLLETRLDPARWHVKSLGDVMDPYLNRVFARPEPYYFYEFEEPRSRVHFGVASEKSRILSVRAMPHRVTVELSASPGDELVLADLDYPGWKLSSGNVVSSDRQTPFRTAVVTAVHPPETPLSVEWVYLPLNLFWATCLSSLGLLGTFLLPKCLVSQTPVAGSEPKGNPTARLPD